MPRQDTIHEVIKRHFLSRLGEEGALARADEEMEFISRHSIQVLLEGEEGYPSQLSQLENPPTMLYQLGNTDLSAHRLVSIVGTRKPTPYGDKFVRDLVGDLAATIPNLCVVSGLAHGIDGAAHRAALDVGVPTIGVVAHGLHTIYPSAHRDLARRMLAAGGSIITEYPSQTSPFPAQFLERNRIVAALSKVTVVAESDERGGSLNTARTAHHLGRVVMALPGRATDRMSSGCLALIRQGKAEIITSASDLVEATGWIEESKAPKVQQLQLFPQMEGDTLKIYQALSQSADPMTMDMLQCQTSLPVRMLVVLLGDMEIDGTVRRYPGNRFAAV